MIDNQHFKATNLIKHIKNNTDENQFLEIITYEFSKSVNRYNIDGIIDILDEILLIKPSLISIIDKATYKIHENLYMVEFRKHYNLSYNLAKNISAKKYDKCYLEDDLNKFKDSYDRLIVEINNHCDNSLELQQEFSTMLFSAIRSCAYNIIEYLIQVIRTDIIYRHLKANDMCLSEAIISKGRYDIKNLLETTGFIFNDCFDRYIGNSILESHDIFMIEYANKYLKADYEILNICRNYDSLYGLYLFNNIPVIYKEMVYKYDLSFPFLFDISKTSNDAFINEALTDIYKNKTSKIFDKNALCIIGCTNIIRTLKPIIRFQFNDFKHAIHVANHDLISIIYHNFYFKPKHIDKLIIDDFETVLKSCNVSSIKIIYELKPSLLNDLINDLTKRHQWNLYYMCDFRNQNVIDTIEFIKSKTDNKQFIALFRDLSVQRYYKHLSANVLIENRMLTSITDTDITFPNENDIKTIDIQLPDYIQHEHIYNFM